MSSFSPNQLRQCARFSGTACTPEKEQKLRDQIHSELAKIKYCSNPTYECSLMRLDGYEYCIRHILRDPRANYRQCTHVYPNGRKCTNAVPKLDTKKEQILTTLCFEHNRQTQLQKTHLSVGRLRSRVETNETLLNNLSHHINVEDIKPELPKPEPDDDEIDVVSPHVTPFVNEDHTNSIGQVVASVRKRRRILDYASDSSSNDDDPPCLRNTARDLEFFESDYESVDSEEDDPLKHAGVYTRAEAVRLSELKLIKLQGLYRDQITHLQHVFKQRRRSYLHDIRRERETYCSIHDQLKETPHERKLYEQLKALNGYHRRQGMEAVLYKKMKEKRTRDTLLSAKSSSQPKCIFTEGGVKCGERTLPCCKHCRKHILEDKRQVLYRACGVERSGVVCQEPVASILEDSTCVLHLNVATAKRQYIQKFYGVPSTSKSESIFAAGRSADSYNSDGDGDGERTVDSNESGNLLDLTNGIFNFDNDIAEDLANSIDENYAMLLNMDCSELGLGLEDPYLNDRGLSLENQEQVSNQGEEAIATPSSNDIQIESSFELNQVDDDIMNILEGIEEMPWFDDLLH
ncbi:KAT8 regulatory NSL complex subunit 2 isoform X2 [Drosophila innubila]|uniref:KAT8 regulatory NSL complex subunit 2 isoform X2 n=1 Tax=Drosophila innubila TaxID=198719 RepID=UPI00148E88BD|nr:KAT8 regulatory NSL complex subunit 2 isoform X2 [Drosophila innubila]